MKRQKITWQKNASMEVLFKLAERCLMGQVRVVHVKNGNTPGIVIYYFAKADA